MLNILRKNMQKDGTDAYVISYSNRFSGQDVLPFEHKLAAVCNFDGSAGALAITADKAFLVVDGRYELQAQKQVDTSKITIINDFPRLKTLCDLLINENVNRIGYDSWNYSVAEMEFIKRKYRNFEFVDVGDYVGLKNDKTVEICCRDEKFSGMKTADKISLVTAKINEKKADYMLMCSADSVSWLLNIYGRDLPYSPVIRAFSLIDKNGKIILFGDNLKSDYFEVQSWQQFIEFMQTATEKTIMFDPHATPEKFKNILNQNAIALKTEDICQDLKAKKNQTELNGMINCHIKDGAALCKLLCWLEENHKGKTELDVVKKLHDLRKVQPLFFSESFATIAGSAEHGAIVHYQPTESSNAVLQEDNLLLLDSGGQYFDGTTDITRTIALGNPDDDMKRDFTYVLKAHIALAKAKFPRETSGYKLDALARAPLWNICADYKHGTGHGVACFGNVHEGPLSISLYGSMYGLKENMVTSIEPGIYKENKYGIRIENLVYIRKVKNQPDFLEFVALTKVPIDKRLIDVKLLDNTEIKWLNSYHREVCDCITPYLTEKEKSWLKNACSPL